MKNIFKKINAVKNLNLPEIIQSYGIPVQHTNNSSYKALCPFHDDKNPSLSISHKNNKWIWHCFGCGAKGSVIDFIMKKEGLNFRQAFSRLNELVSTETPPAKETPRVTVKPKQEDRPAEEKTRPELNPQDLLNKSAQFYHEAFKENRQGLEYLLKRGIIDQSIYLNYKIGYVHGGLRRTLPGEGPMVDGLKQIGILTDKGTEFFYNCVTFPVFDEDDNVVEMYGRHIERPQHLYLPGPHRSVFNLRALPASKKIILTESIIDSLSLIQLGIVETVPLYGTNGLTEDHIELLKKHQTRKVYLCLDNDQAGREATVKIAGRLKEIGVMPYETKLPAKVKDLNEYLLLGGGNMASFNELLEQSAYLGDESDLFKDDPTVTQEEDQVTFEFNDRSYRVRGLTAARLDQLKVNIKMTTKTDYHLDTFDLYSAKARGTFTTQARKILNVEAGVISRDLAVIVENLESMQMKMLEDKDQKKKEIEMSETEAREAMEFLESDNLIDQIVKDFKEYGHVGEETNLLLGYLASISRKLSTPLAILVVSRSASGKSTLQDAILSFTPPEDYDKYTRLTDQALFYKNEDALKHKLLAIEEERGASGCAYSLRVLQSAQVLTNAATTKDPLTGKLKTETYRVSGPTAIMITTTYTEEFDYETYNRFIVLTIDESLGQTKKILEKQRINESLEGVLRKKKREKIKRRHHNAQRLLRPMEVVNPYADRLTFVDTILRARREQPKYLTLIKIVALLRQYQKEIRTIDQDGEAIEYIEVDLKDIEIANGIANEILGRNLDELAPPSRNLLKELRVMVDKRMETERLSQEEIVFTRKDIREYTSWSDYQIKVHIGQLQDLEYLEIVTGGRGKTYSYRLLWDGKGLDGENFMMGLIDVEMLKTSRAETPAGRVEVGR